ncbi:type 1 fimbrial protein [Salmonella enterica]
MKTEKVLSVLLGLGVMVVSVTACAAVTGTQTFKAAITTGTCTVPGSQMVQTIDFGNISMSDMQSGGDEEPDAGIPVENRNIHFDVAGCPDSVSVVGLDVSFTPWSEAHPGWIKNTSPDGATGVVMVITDSGGAVIKTGGVLAPPEPLRGGFASIDGAVHIYRVVPGKSVTTGAVSGEVTLGLYAE